ncbi:MAG: hypothetical protein M5R36_07200 [Deltaproteobacteria bacterium]|nr:hypothetical protein [Deltaproteobacteria bacterium]
MVASAFAWSIGCGDDDDDNDDGDDDDDDDDGECPEATEDLSVCDPANGPFTLEIDNPFYPLPVGLHLVLEGEEDGEELLVEIDVLDETEEVAGVTTRVVTETEYEGGELVEVSWNWFAQAPDGTVCYFGEEVDDYEDGELVGHSGEWRAGEDGAQPGIIMTADPSVGEAYFQEFYEGEAEDMSEHVALGETVSTPAGDFDDTLSVLDYNPLEGCEPEPKAYARGIGLIQDETLFLTESSL